jgi:hypothetical protein
MWDQVSRANVSRVAANFPHNKLDIFGQCEALHGLHEERVVSRHPLGQTGFVPQEYYHDSARH